MSFYALIEVLTQLVAFQTQACNVPVALEKLDDRRTLFEGNFSNPFFVLSSSQSAAATEMLLSVTYESV